MDIMSLFSGLSAATKAAKDLKDLHEFAASAEAKLKLVMIIDSLTEAKSALSDQKEKNAELESKIKKLYQSKADIAKLSRNGELFLDPNDNQFKCPTCIETKQLIVSLIVKPGHPSNLKCNNCDSQFNNPNYKRQNAENLMPRSGPGGPKSWQRN